jgi:hypothetical protein
VQEHGEPAATVEPGRASAGDCFHQQGMLGDGKNVCTLRLSVPSRYPRKAVGDIGDLDIKGRGVKQVEPAS